MGGVAVDDFDRTGRLVPPISLAREVDTVRHTDSSHPDDGNASTRDAKVSNKASIRSAARWRVESMVSRARTQRPCSSAGTDKLGPARQQHDRGTTDPGHGPPTLRQPCPATARSSSPWSSPFQAVLGTSIIPRAGRALGSPNLPRVPQPR